MSKILFIGDFSDNTNGQTIRTKNTFKALSIFFGKKSIKTLKTNKYKSIKPIFLIIMFLRLIFTKNVILMATSKQSIVYYLRIIRIIKKINVKLNVLFVSVGGELPEQFNNEKKISKNFKYIDYIFVQTESIKEEFKIEKKDNIILLKNYRNLPILQTWKTEYAPPFKLVVFSRLTEDKGVFRVIDSIKMANNTIGEKAFTLSLFGPIDKEIEKRLFNEINENPEVLNYGGIVDYNKSNEILKDYFALCFISSFPGEGFAGTFIDAFFAGLPIIANKWKSNEDVIIDGVNGFIVEDDIQLVNLLIEIYNKPSMIIDLKVNCVEESKKYTLKEVDILIEKIK